MANRIEKRFFRRLLNEINADGAEVNSGMLLDVGDSDLEYPSGCAALRLGWRYLDNETVWISAELIGDDCSLVGAWGRAFPLDSELASAAEAARRLQRVLEDMS